MKIVTPDYYKDFRCIAGDCTDTCCAAEDILRYHRAKEVDDRLMPIKEIITLIDEL